MKTSELTGAALDWAVACSKSDTYATESLPSIAAGFKPARYSTDWSQGGPIIEREKIATDWSEGNKWCASCDTTDKVFSAATLLIAAMRCYVASKLGDEVEVPKELT